MNELRGIPCIELEEVRPNKKGICVSRSFGKMIDDFQTLSESLSSHANRASQKLREQDSNCSQISVFIHTNRFRSDLPQYFASKDIQLALPTNDGGNIIKAALRGLELIYKNGYKYKKCGIFLNEISPSGTIQQSLFEEDDSLKKKRLNKALDLLNKKYGKETILYAVQGYKKEWKLRQENLSLSYTTKISDIPIINLNKS